MGSDETVAELDRAQGRLDAVRREQAHRWREHEDERRKQAERERLEIAWRHAWAALQEADREAIRQAATGGKPCLARTPKLVEALCLDELARRRG